MVLTTNQKTVKGIQWDSRDGAVMFRYLFSNGSKGPLAFAGFDLLDPQACEKMHNLEKEKIGKKIG